MDDGIEELRTSGALLPMPTVLAAKAEALYLANRTAEALDTIREIRACIANASVTTDSEFCPVCICEGTLAGGVESGESFSEDAGNSSPKDAAQRLEHYELVTNKHGGPMELCRGAASFFVRSACDCERASSKRRLTRGEPFCSFEFMQLGR